MKGNPFDCLFFLNENTVAICALTSSQLVWHAISAGTPALGAIWQPLEYLNALMNT